MYQSRSKNRHTTLAVASVDLQTPFLLVAFALPTPLTHHPPPPHAFLFQRTSISGHVETHRHREFHDIRKVGLFVVQSFPIPLSLTLPFHPRLFPIFFLIVDEQNKISYRGERKIAVREFYCRVTLKNFGIGFSLACKGTVVRIGGGGGGGGRGWG